MIKKTCSGDWECCSYARFGDSCYVNCGFPGYCNFQLPNNPNQYQEHDPNQEMREDIENENLNIRKHKRPRYNVT